MIQRFHISRGRAASVVGMAAIAATLAACGSSTPNSPSSSGSPDSPGSSAQPAQPQLRQDAVRFADCMRSHGVRNWPDPTSSGVFDKSKLQRLGLSTSQIHPIAIACGHLLPDGGSPSQSQAHSHAQFTALLAFARCLRRHGFPAFPDPTSSGQVTHQMLAAAGIDLHQPAVLRTADACVGVTHGVLTKAAIARFVAGR